LIPVGGNAELLFAQQQRTVSGKVTDTGSQPLPGVSVVIKGTTQGAVTNSDGEYTLFNVPENATLIFSFVGMRTHEIAVENLTRINVRMEEEIIGLDEVVAVGYGVQKKVNVTGAITTVSSDKIMDRPNTSLAQALQGVVPNLQIATTDGGRPGSNMTWQIRGQGTLGRGGSSTAPLFIIDGVSGDPNFINPEDIESISILKDAAASAIYGSRAPYGVVIISTKKGKSEQMKVTFSSLYGWASLLTTLHPMGSLDYVHYINTGNKNRGVAVTFNDDYINDIKYHIEHPESPERIVNPSNPNSYYRNVATDHNWWRTTYRDWAPRQNYNISASGGSKYVSYYFSLGLLNQDGQYRYGDDNFKRYSGLLNLQAKATEWMDIGYKSQVIRRNNDAPTSTAQDWMQMTAFRGWPILPLIDPNGHYDYFGSGIQQAVEGGRFSNINDAYINSLSFVIKPLKGLRLNGDLTLHSNDDSEIENTKVAYTHRPNGEVSGTQQGAGVSNIRIMKGHQKKYDINTYVDYSTSFDKHNLLLLGGYQQEYYFVHKLTGKRSNLISEDIPSLNIATGDDLQSTEYKAEWATQGFFGRFTYNLDEKYLFELNGRYDGSSRFPENYRWGFFPSVSVGYVLSKEGYFASLKSVIDFLKLRASYGTLGNTNVGIYYSASMSKQPSNYLGPDGKFLDYVSTPGLGNYNLSWERPTTLNIAVDLGLLNNRLQTSFDWYERKTVDMVGPSEPVASVLGTIVPLSNNTELKGNGWELSLSYKGNVRNDFRYEAGFNISRHRETVTKFYNPKGLLSTHYEGMILGTIWGYETVGFINDEETLKSMANQSYIHARWGLGDIQYKDQLTVDTDGDGIPDAGDGKINEGLITIDDHGDLIIIGNSTPAFEYNFTLGCDYKGVDLKIIGIGLGHTDFWPGGGQGFRTAYGTNIFFGNGQHMNHSVLEEHKDHWTPDNHDAYYARPLIGNVEGMKNYKIQTKYLQNRAFLRLKNVQLGYTLPTHLTKQVLIQNARIYISGENMLTFTKLRIFDPETPGYIYPLQKVISAGVKVTF
jgi:TonB-linked SusC/RagA family outer membrane protein